MSPKHFQSAEHFVTVVAFQVSTFCLPDEQMLVLYQLFTGGIRHEPGCFCSALRLHSSAGSALIQHESKKCRFQENLQRQVGERTLSQITEPNTFYFCLFRILSVKFNYFRFLKIRSSAVKTEPNRKLRFQVLLGH